MSKPVFAYTVLQLHEQGILDLDTPLTSYAPEGPIAGDPRLDRVTARHVLSHTSGLPNWRSGAEPLAFQFTPGERWLYSGEGYAWLQSVVTHLTGRVDPDVCGTYEADVRVCATDIDEHMKAHLLVPFGMHSSGYVWNDTLAARAARPHDTSGAPLTKGHPNAADAARYASAGGLHATPTEFAQFLLEVIDPKPGAAFRLRQGTRDEMIRPAVKVSDGPRSSSWALGWQVLHTDSGDVIAHGGDNPGFHAFSAASVPRRTGLVIMTNGDGGPKVLERIIFGGLMDRILMEMRS
jgi:CubicO group peptidase (beta-lactamase class C family)